VRPKLFHTNCWVLISLVSAFVDRHSFGMEKFSRVDSVSRAVVSDEKRAGIWESFDSPRVKIGLFVVCGFVLILPIWLVKYPPIVDYPNHLARAFVLHHLNDPNYSFSHWYAPDWGPNPYFLADFLMQIFQRCL
jgi:hypothetical protein